MLAMYTRVFCHGLYMKCIFLLYVYEAPSPLLCIPSSTLMKVHVNEGPSDCYLSCRYQSVLLSTAVYPYNCHMTIPFLRK
jgi:hypothetical protein